MLSVLSAILLILAFPKTDLYFLAWFGLVPLMFALDGKPPRRAFGTAYLCGVVFFGGIFYWLYHVTIIGLIAMVLYMAVYYGVFGLVYAWGREKNPLFKALWLACFWVVLEFIRSYLLSGFNWGSLGLSQYCFLPMIQIADVTGMYGISFVLVVCNVAIKEFLSALLSLRRKQKPVRGVVSLIVFTAALVALVGGYGPLGMKKNLTESPRNLRVAVIQANIPQAWKWNESVWPKMFDVYERLTAEVIDDNPDLIVWPETSFPGILSESSLNKSGEETFLIKEERNLAALKKRVRFWNVPLLIGLVTENNNSFYNSAVLLSPQDGFVEKYNKLHLVAFGEYVPLRHIFPFLSKVVPIADFTAGKGFTVFPAVGPSEEVGGRFSALICFEDSVERLSRVFVRNGAEFLVNITNDGWFGDTKAPFMHLQSSVLRAVETRRSVVRAANTGVSCFIGPGGRFYNPVQSSGRPGSENPEEFHLTYVEGTSLAEIPLNTPLSFYVKYGDVFVALCWLGLLAGFWGTRRKHGGRRA